MAALPSGLLGNTAMAARRRPSDGDSTQINYLTGPAFSRPASPLDDPPPGRQAKEA
jgi:hypothetical protein